MKQKKKGDRTERILLAAACGLFAVLVFLTVTLTVMFYRSSEKHTGSFDIGMITSDDGEREDISSLLIPSFIGITSAGDRTGISASFDITEDIFRTLSPTISYIFAKNSVTEVGEEVWRSLVSEKDSVYIRFHSQMPECVVRMFVGMLSQTEYGGDDNDSYIYEMFVVPYAEEGDIIRLLTRSVDGKVMQYTAHEPEIYVTSSEIETMAVSYSSSLIDFSFAKDEYPVLSYTEPLFHDHVETNNIIVTNRTSMFAYDAVSGVEQVIGAFGMNPDKVRVSVTDDNTTGYIDSKGAFYVRDSGFEYRSTTDGGIEMSRFTGYTGGDGHSVGACIRAAAGLLSEVRALDKNYAGADADVYLSSVSSSGSEIKVELSYCYNNIPFTDMAPAVSITVKDGLVKQIYLYTVAVRGRSEKSKSFTENVFAGYLANRGLGVYNITLKYRADYSSESVKAEWFGESDE